MIRQEEQPVIKLPEVLEQNATSPVLVEDPELDTAETDEGGNATVVKKGEPVAVINDKVDSNVNLGLIKGVGAGPAGPALAGPLFSNQV